MRLWHKDLITVLPKQQLLGQWRELNSIFKLRNKHILINFVYDDNWSLYNYTLLVIKEMQIRGYNCNLKNMIFYFEGKYEALILDDSIQTDAYIFPYEEIFAEKMNKEYLTICYYNLLEKYRCGGITKNEWEKVEKRYKELTNVKRS